MLNIPRIVIAGTHSGVGKTTIATGLMAALTASGLKVQGFKVGPDYIDPSYHTRATGRPSRNLDTWLLGEQGVRELFQRSAQDADIAVIEGVMGMFDGFGGTSDLGSTAHVAKVLQAPVILIVNAKSMSRSIAAMIKGYCDLDPEVRVKGVILNRVASVRHREILREAVSKYNPVSLVGTLSADSVVPWPERHLGLIPMSEQGETGMIFQELGRVVARSLDLSLVRAIAGSAPDLSEVPREIFSSGARCTGEVRPGAKVKIAYAWDEAFSFYYRDSLDLLVHHGAELVKVSPLHDSGLPADISGLLIGGGFPELFLPELSSNQSFITSLQQHHQDGLPIYAECGGLMYLTEAIENFNQETYPMVGLIPGKCRMEKKLAALGYYQGIALQDNLLCAKDTPVKGHEFHYSKLEGLPREFPWAFGLNKGEEQPWRQEGFARGNLLAAYLHMHFAGLPGLAEAFVRRCRDFAASHGKH